MNRCERTIRTGLPPYRRIKYAGYLSFLATPIRRPMPTSRNIPVLRIRLKPASLFYTATTQISHSNLQSPVSL